MDQGSVNLVQAPPIVVIGSGDFESFQQARRRGVQGYCPILCRISAESAPEREFAARQLAASRHGLPGNSRSGDVRDEHDTATGKAASIFPDFPRNNNFRRKASFGDRSWSLRPFLLLVERRTSGSFQRINGKLLTGSECAATRPAEANIERDVYEIERAAGGAQVSQIRKPWRRCQGLSRETPLPRSPCTQSPRPGIDRTVLALRFRVA